MGIFDFVKDAGASLLGMKTSSEKKEEARIAKMDQIGELVRTFELGIEDLAIEFGGDDDEIIILNGKAHSQADKEKFILSVGNMKGVAQVDDRLIVESPEPEAAFYTVKSGDSLSKIAKAHYGDAMKYPAIFEANKPMLKDVNLIYPGQVLRLPVLD